MNGALPSTALDGFAALLQLEKMALEAESLQETRFVITNATSGLSPYVQAVFLGHSGSRSLRVQCLSSVSDVDRTSPFVAWVERVAKHLDAGGEHLEAKPVTPDQLSAELRRDWAELASAYLLWLPLNTRGTDRQGVLLLSREAAWSPQELALLKHLSLVYGHALERFASRSRRRWMRWRTALAGLAVIAAVVAASLTPMRLSVLAPAEIVASDPFVVSAPIDGVVRQLMVLPNQAVNRGSLLVELESGDLRGTQEVAARSLEVANAELRRSQQAAFVDPARKAELAILQAQVDRKVRELSLAQSRVGKTQLRADRPGVVVVDDPQVWKGRPVRIGERILQIADPKRVEVTIMVPVKDAVALSPGNEVRLFLDTDPLRSLKGTVSYVVYESTMMAEWPAYRVTARLDPAHEAPRIGLRGTARIYGEETSLIYYLLRRPITVARQWLGW